MAKKAKPTTPSPTTLGEQISFTEDELLSAVTTRIAASGCPDPSLMVEDMDPLAALWIAHELVQEVLGVWTSALVNKPPEDEDEMAMLAKPLAGVTGALDNLTRACVWAGMLPAKVLEGMDEL